MTAVRLVPEDLLVVTGCGCRRTLSGDPDSEIRCRLHHDRAGWKYPGDPFVQYYDDIRAMETFKALPGNRDIACASIDCVNRNDDELALHGFCGDCATRKREYELFEEMSEREWLAKPAPVRLWIRSKARILAMIDRIASKHDPDSPF